MEGKETSLSFSGKISFWLIILTITLLFGSLGLAFTSLVGPKVQLELPPVFYLSTGVLLLSSVLLHMGWLRHDNKTRSGMLRPVIALGMAFLLGQAYGWYQLLNQGLTFRDGGQIASFLYILTGLHALHLLVGLGLLAYVGLTKSPQRRKYLEVSVYFWHFLGVLWVYLLCLLLVQG